MCDKLLFIGQITMKNEALMDHIFFVATESANVMIAQLIHHVYHRLDFFSMCKKRANNNPLVLGNMPNCSQVTAPEVEELQQIVWRNNKTDGNIESEADVARRKAVGRHMMEDFPTRDAYYPQQHQNKFCEQ